MRKRYRRTIELMVKRIDEVEHFHAMFAQAEEEGKDKG
jgi:hypothetical protein